MFNNAEPSKLTNWNSIDCGNKELLGTAIISGYEKAVVFADGLQKVECCLSLAFLFLIAGQVDWMMALCLLNVRGFERDEYISRYDRWPDD